MRLLFAEDEKELSNAVSAILRHNNYSVDTVYNGIDAIDYLELGEYDGVILDIMMPGADGLTVLKKNSRCRQQCARAFAYRQIGN